jgi:hypothetical protein
VYDVLGNKVATLIENELSAGEYEVEFSTLGTSRDFSLPSGIYFYTLRADNHAKTKKMILLR